MVFPLWVSLWWRRPSEDVPKAALCTFTAAEENWGLWKMCQHDGWLEAGFLPGEAASCLLSREGWPGAWLLLSLLRRLLGCCDKVLLKKDAHVYDVPTPHSVSPRLVPDCHLMLSAWCSPGQPCL